MQNIKLLTGVSVLLLLAYISIGVFGLFEFNHTPETPMVNCPYAENSFSVCENSLSHINNWRQFSNITLPLLFVFSILILGMVLYFLGKQKFLNQKQYFYKWKFYLDNRKRYTYPDRIIKWLSLFENSPSFSYKI
ncbi:MAG: hypothetical protein AAB501_02600 [Patescibacteria group bacterium]